MNSTLYESISYRCLFLDQTYRLEHALVVSNVVSLKVYDGQSFLMPIRKM